jgi:hypothetical protein
VNRCSASLYLDEFFGAWACTIRAKACPALDAGWIPVRVKKTRQNKNKNLEPRYDSIGTEKALAANRSGAMIPWLSVRGCHVPKHRLFRPISIAVATWSRVADGFDKTAETASHFVDALSRSPAHPVSIRANSSTAILIRSCPVNELAMDFPADRVDNGYLEILIVAQAVVAEMLRKFFAVRDSLKIAVEVDPDPVSERDAIFHIKKVLLHCRTSNRSSFSASWRAVWAGVHFLLPMRVIGSNPAARRSFRNEAVEGSSTKSHLALG